MIRFARFLIASARLVLSGGTGYRAWLVFLVALIAWGGYSYAGQLSHGLIVTNMRDQVSWAFYIGNFTFLVGVAAAAVMLVIPAYIYEWGPIKEIVILGEILAISAIVMCLLFVTVDVGHPERVWHLFPVVGRLNFPSSLLAWDFFVLNAYLGLNAVIVFHLLYSAYCRRDYNHALITPLVLLSIPAAISIHTVTAFLYNGLAARPFWNSAILAPRFIASAFCSGPAILVILFQILRRTTKFKIRDEAIWKIAELMAYAMFLNLFLFGAEIFKEYYSHTEHLLYTQYLYSGIEGHKALVPYAWLAVLCSIIAFVILLIPATRRHPITLNLGCVLIYAGVYIEKGMALVMPGFTPDTLGEIYEYVPTITEVSIGAGIFSVGFLIFTLLTKLAVAIVQGEFHAPGVPAPAEEPAAAA
ncbi:MAG: polysulfide reductase NrfD [Planctomycetes bacterium]|nr:polysulfide reductase NrfD [Planctomycetota bacterium]